MTETAKSERLSLCPSCGAKGRRVGTATLRALLRDECAADFNDAGAGTRCANEPPGSTDCKPVSGESGWRFCDSQDCDVVYFAEDGSQSFAKSQLRVPVGVKEKTGERPLCYCFGHSVASIKQELRTKGRSGAPDDIRAKMKDPGCHCETTNPSGSCCLGSVTRGIKIAREELDMNDSDVQTPAIPAKSSSNRGETVAKIGTVVSAIMASACCWLPLVLLAVGISGAGIAATLEAYRPIFMVVTFGFLGAAFYFTYGPKRTTGDGGHACCAPEASGKEDCCAPATRRRFSMIPVNKAMLWVVTVLAVALLLFPSYVGAFLGGGNSKTVTEKMNRAVIQVEGMTCEGCSAIVAKAIRSAPGVLAVEVDYKKGEAIVGSEACCPIPRNGILAALQDAGYTGKFIDSNQPASP